MTARPRRRKALGTSRWRKTRLVVLARDGNRCYLCGGVATEVDHVWPVGRGGEEFDPENLAAACRRCNRRKSDKMPGRSRPVAAKSTHRKIDPPSRSSRRW